MYGNTMAWNEVGDYNNNFNFPLNKNKCDANFSLKEGCAGNVTNLTGNFGLQLSADVYPACGYYPYAQAMAQEQQQLREAGALSEGFYANQYRMNSGF